MIDEEEEIEVVLISSATAPEKCLMAQICRACWEPQEEGMMSTSTIFPHYKTKVIEPVGVRKQLQGVANNLEPAQHKLNTLPQLTVRLSISPVC